MSTSDKKRLSDHFDHVRTVELAVGPQAQEPGLPLCQPPGSMPQGGDTGDLNQMIRNADLQAQVTALAFACGVKRAATLQIGDGTNGVSFGMPYGYHAISHRVTNNNATGPSIGAAVAQGYHKQN